MEQFYPPFPKKALTLPWLWQEDQPPEKTTQSCNAAKKRHLSPCVHLWSRDGWIFPRWYRHGESTPAFTGHRPNLDLWGPEQKGIGFEGIADCLVTLQEREGLSMMCPECTHRPWLGSTGPGTGCTALTKNLWSTEKMVGHTPEIQLSAGLRLYCSFYIFLTLDTCILIDY